MINNVIYLHLKNNSNLSSKLLVNTSINYLIQLKIDLFMTWYMYAYLILFDLNICLNFLLFILFVCVKVFY